MRRVVVYGSSGVGKSTFASELARSHRLKHVEIDLLAYDSEGAHVEHELLRERFHQALAAEAWVVEGMHRDELYRALRSADTFVWLDYPKAVVARRMSVRLLRHLIFRQRRHGRRVTVRSALKRELPFIRKTLASYERRRTHGQALMNEAAALGLRRHHPRSPSEAGRLVRSMNAGRAGTDEERA